MNDTFHPSTSARTDCMDLYAHGKWKFPNAGLLTSSLGRGWSGLAAELRAHPAGDLPSAAPEEADTSPTVKITIAVRGSDKSTVRRHGAGGTQQARARTGTIWLCRVGVGEGEINISEPIPETLHVYLPVERFQFLSDIYADSSVRAEAIRYVSGVSDPLIWQLGLSILGELKEETVAGRMLVESAAHALTARLVQAYSQDSSGVVDAPSGSGLERTRLHRVLDYINDHLDDDLSVADLAAVACLSPFHFARSFRKAVGVPPHGYVSRQRLERAKVLLTSGDQPLTEIAFDSGFSSQSSFNRAFRRVTGLSPAAYRRMMGK